jgi:AcrR family transcriptional regulator
MNTARGYSMQSRAASVETTRARIVDGALELFLERWYDDVTLADIARVAGVSGQTVINHFGGKEQVFAVAIERAGAELQARRYRARPGDVEGAIEALVDDYEITGDATIRLLALEERLPAVQPVMEIGRAGHREWIETMFAAPAVTAELVVVTDVYAWKLLRRDQGLSRDATVAAIHRMVDGLLAASARNDHETRRRSG